MRRLVAALLAGALALLLSAQAVSASSFVCEARPTRSCSVNWTTSGGDLLVQVDAEKPTKATYYWDVRDLTTGLVYCQGVRSTAHSECLIPGGPASDWELTIFPTSGHLRVTITVP
jgi:hypothetical protein